MKNHCNILQRYYKSMMFYLRAYSPQFYCMLLKCQTYHYARYWLKHLLVKVYANQHKKEYRLHSIKIILYCPQAALQSILESDKQKVTFHIISSDTGNRTPVSSVTGRDTSHYTMSDLFFVYVYKLYKLFLLLFYVKLLILFHFHNLYYHQVLKSMETRQRW